MMKNIWALLLGIALSELPAFSQAPAQPQSQTETNRPARRVGARDPKMDAYYKLGPDSMPHEGVSKGHFDGPKVIQSEVFPGTQHTYWVYVPAQYDPAK